MLLTYAVCDSFACCVTGRSERMVVSLLMMLNRRGSYLLRVTRAPHRVDSKPIGLSAAFVPLLAGSTFLGLASFDKIAKGAELEALLRCCRGQASGEIDLDDASAAAS